MAVTKKTTKPTEKTKAAQPVATSDKATKKNTKPPAERTPEQVKKDLNLAKGAKAAAKATSIAKSVQSSRDEDQQRETKKAGPAPKSGEQIKKDSMKPALDAKRKQDAENRSAQLLETGLVTIDPKDAKIPLDVEPINASLKDEPDGLVEFEVQGTSLRLLALRDPNATPTLAQRLSIARRLLEVGPKLPKYIKTVEQKKPDFSNAEIKVARGEEKVEGAPSNKPAGAGNSGNGKTSSIANGVPLKKICADIDIDPKLARRILRSKGKKPGGRWEWEAKEVDDVKKLIKDEAKKLADAGK